MTTCSLRCGAGVRGRWRVKGGHSEQPTRVWHGQDVRRNVGCQLCVHRRRPVCEPPTQRVLCHVTIGTWDGGRPCIAAPTATATATVVTAIVAVVGVATSSKIDTAAINRQGRGAVFRTSNALTVAEHRRRRSVFMTVAIRRRRRRVVHHSSHTACPRTSHKRRNVGCGS